MSTEVMSRLPHDANVAGWTPQQTAIMTQLGLVNRTGYNGRDAPDAPVGVIESFLAQCERTQLDPLNRQIYCIERGGKWGVQISIDGFRLLAERTSGYRGQTPAEWCGPDGVWRDVWLDTVNAPAAARVGVLREGFSEPMYAVATFAGYCPRDRDGNLAPRNQWASNPSNQLAKCAEMLALRKAFPADFSGLYGAEEMDQANSEASHQQQAKPVQQRRQGSSRGQQRAAQPQVLSELEWNTWRERLSQASSRDDALDVWRAAQSDNMLGKVLPPTDGVAQGTTLGQFIKEFGKEVARREKEAEAAAEPAPNEDVAQVVEDSPAVEVTGEPVKSPDEEWADKVESGELKADEAF